MKRPRITTALAIGAAILLTSAAGATATALITGAQIKDGTVTGADISGSTHLQFKGTATGAESASPVTLVGIDNGMYGGESVKSRPARQIVAKSNLSVPFTGRVQVTGTVTLDIVKNSFGNYGRAYGNCSTDIVKLGGEAPRGGYQLPGRVSGQAGQYNLFARYEESYPGGPPVVVGDHSADISIIGGKEITQPGMYTVYVTCANTRNYPDGIDINATAKFEARATAN